VKINRHSLSIYTS